MDSIAFGSHRLGEAGVHDDLAAVAANEPNEIIQRHRPVVRIAADEVLRGTPVVMGVFEGVNLVLLLHAMRTRANLRLPTWITTVVPCFSFSVRSASFSPSIFTPPCSIMR